MVYIHVVPFRSIQMLAALPSCVCVCPPPPPLPCVGPPPPFVCVYIYVSTYALS